MPLHNIDNYLSTPSEVEAAQNKVRNVKRKRIKDFKPDMGWFYARRMRSLDNPKPVYITGGHRVLLASGFESVDAFEWYGPVVGCEVAGEADVE